MIESFLHTIDSAFKDKSKREMRMVYIMIFGLMFAISYMFFWDNSQGDFLNKRAQINSLETKTKMEKMYLQINSDSKIAKLKLDINKANKELLSLKDNNAYIKNKIETISSLIYDENTWVDHLHSVSSNAQKFNIKILEFKNENVKQQKEFGHVLDIDLKITGSYKNTLKFINSLEQSELVLDIHSLEMVANETLGTNLNISVWGITY